MAANLTRNTNQRLRACWSQCLQPAQKELEQRLREWNSCANNMPIAAESARRANEVARNAEQLYARGHQRAVLAKGNHDAAWRKLLSPRLVGSDYGALVAAEHRARAAHGIVTRDLENIRRQVETARVATVRAAGLVGGCDDWVSFLSFRLGGLRGARGGAWFAACCG